MLQSPITPPTRSAELQAALDAIEAACATNKPAGFWGAACVRRVLYGDTDPVVQEALKLRPVKVIDPETESNGFVLFPMPAERVAP